MSRNRGAARRSGTVNRAREGSDRGPESFSRLGTLGVEEELFVVDGAGRPTAAAERLVETCSRPTLEGQLDNEMYRCIIETKTPVCDDLSALGREVERVRRALVAYATDRGYGIAAAGLHPGTQPDALEVCSNRRYRTMLDRLRHPQSRNTTTGLHVHVGVDDPDKAAWVTNQIRWYMPVMLALSANSPFHGGVDTGLASARAHVFGELPNTGIPPTFDSYDAFASFRETMLRTGTITDPGQLWWDVRLNDECGTVEIRAPDAQSSLDAVLAFAEYARRLVLDLAARYEDGETATVDCREAFLDHNRWQAVRYGHDATFVDCDGEGTVSLAETVDRECHRLDVDGIERLVRRESGAERQRRLYYEDGLPTVCDALRLGSAADRAFDSERDPRSPDRETDRPASAGRPGQSALAHPSH